MCYVKFTPEMINGHHMGHRELTKRHRKSLRNPTLLQSAPRRLQKLSESDKAEYSDRRKFWLKLNIFTMPHASSVEKITDLSLHISKQATCEINPYPANVENWVSS